MLWSDISQMDVLAIAKLVAFVVVPLALLWEARRNVRADLLADWSSARFVAVPEGHREAVTHYLHRLVWARGIGAAVGWAGGFFVPVPVGPLAGLLLGYLLATLLAEVTAQRTLGRGVAALAPRRLEAYVPASTVAVARAVAAVTVVIGAVPLVARVIPFFAGSTEPTERARWAILAVAVGVSVFGLAGEALTRRVVARRQTAGSAELLALDDALRSTSAHLLMTSVRSVELLGAGLVAAAAGIIVASPVLRWTFFAVAIAAYIAAVAGAMHLFALRPWRVRRSSAATV